MSKPKHMDYIVSRILEIQEEQCKIQPEISALLREQKEIKSTLANILSAIEKGIVSNTTNSRLQELEARQLEIEEQLIKEQSKTQTKITEQEIRKFYQKILGEEPHAIVSFFLKEVVLFEDRIEIRLNSPKGINPNESQDFSFCRQIYFENQNTEIIRFFIAF